jgi:hypothetical protein
MKESSSQQPSSVHLSYEISNKPVGETLAGRLHLENLTDFFPSLIAAYPDPIATAKATGKHFGGNTQHNVHPTPDSQPGASDGKLGGKNSPNGRQGWADINPAAAPNTYTGNGGSKRD